MDKKSKPSPSRGEPNSFEYTLKRVGGGSEGGNGRTLCVAKWGQKQLKTVGKVPDEACQNNSKRINFTQSRRRHRKKKDYAFKVQARGESKKM